MRHRAPAPGRRDDPAARLDPHADRGCRSARSSACSSSRGALPAKLRVGEILEEYPLVLTATRRTSANCSTFSAWPPSAATTTGRCPAGSGSACPVALALIGQPRVAVLDEMTTGLDPQARRDTWELIEGIRDRGVTIVLVTHFMEEAERLCDRVALIDRGRVVALDTPARLADQARGGKTVRFLPSAPFGDGMLTGLPEVSRGGARRPARRRHRDRRARQRGDPRPASGRGDRPRRPARLVETSRTPSSSSPKEQGRSPGMSSLSTVPITGPGRCRGPREPPRSGQVVLNEPGSSGGSRRT